MANDLMVLSDEVYERLIYDGEKHVSIASLPGMKERTFTLNGMSKAYAMDGWRLGYVAAPEEYILAMNKFHQYNTTCAPNFVQLASAAALNEEGDEVNAMVREYKRRRDHAVKAINEIPGFKLPVPEGSVLHIHQHKRAGNEERRGGGLSSGGSEDRAGSGGCVRTRRRGISENVLCQQL